MKRVMVLGRGGAGKSAFGRRLAQATVLPLLELDSVFWREDLSHPTAAEWVATQEELVAMPAWILDGDLGRYDVLTPRLRAADTIVILDFSLWRSAWQWVRRGRERRDYWTWVMTLRRRHLPNILREIQAEAPLAQLRVARGPRDLEFRSWSLGRDVD